VNDNCEIMPIDLDLEFKDYYSEDAYMVADVETGVLYNRSGRRMLALTDDFLIGFHRAIEKECGSRTPEVLHTCGRRWGINFGTGLAAEWSEFYGRPFANFRYRSLPKPSHPRVCQ
jgi:predicted hydrocarbon binding protein